MVWAVVMEDAFNALNPRGRFGLGVTGVPIGAWVTTGLPAGMVGMCEVNVEWAVWRGIVGLGPMDVTFGRTGGVFGAMVGVVVKVVVLVK